MEGWEEGLPRGWCAQGGGCSLEPWGCVSCQEPVWPLPLFEHQLLAAGCGNGSETAPLWLWKPPDGAVSKITPSCVTGGG